VYHNASHLDWDTRVSLSLPEFYGSARSAVYFTAGATTLWFISFVTFQTRVNIIMKGDSLAEHDDFHDNGGVSAHPLPE
jgi:hypothetical protein